VRYAYGTEWNIAGSAIEQCFSKDGKLAGKKPGQVNPS